MKARTAIAVAAATVVVACGRGPEPTSPESLANATYLTDATPEGRVTLVGGAFDFSTGPVERVELVSSGAGDIDGDDDPDAAVVLVETSGRSRLFRLHAVLGDGRTASDVAARLIGDRIEVREVRIEDGLISLDLMVREAGSSQEADPSVPITSRFALTDRGLIPADMPSVDESAPRAMPGGDVATLPSHEWILERIEMGDWSQATDELAERPWLRFHRELGDDEAGTGTMYADAGCNRLFGSYERGADGSLRVRGIASTRRACPEPLADLEQRLAAALEAARTFAITDDVLRIEFDGGVLQLRAGRGLLPPPAPGDPTTVSGQAGRPT